MKDGSKWHFNGYVKRFGVGRHRGRDHDRRATVMRGMSSTTASCRSVPMRA
jgi:hypothetical protein